MVKWDYAEVFDLDKLKVFLGENKQDKYLRKFGIRTYNNSSQNLPRWAKLSWNWSAFFAGVIWMGYRKMYIELIVFSILIILPNLIVSNLSNTEDTIITAFYWLALGLISNSLYYAKCKREITRIKSLNLSQYDELEALHQKGGTSIAGIFISVLILIINIPVYLVVHLYL
jgi:hypothetical protein